MRKVIGAMKRISLFYNLSILLENRIFEHNENSCYNFKYTKHIRNTKLFKHLLEQLAIPISLGLSKVWRHVNATAGQSNTERMMQPFFHINFKSQFPKVSVCGIVQRLTRNRVGADILKPIFFAPSCLGSDVLVRYVLALGRFEADMFWRGDVLKPTHCFTGKDVMLLWMEFNPLHFTWLRM